MNVVLPTPPLPPMVRMTRFCGIVAGIVSTGRLTVCDVLIGITRLIWISRLALTARPRHTRKPAFRLPSELAAAPPESHVLPGRPAAAPGGLGPPPVRLLPRSEE